MGDGRSGRNFRKGNFGGVGVLDVRPLDFYGLDFSTTIIEFVMLGQYSILSG